MSIDTRHLDRVIALRRRAQRERAFEHAMASNAETEHRSAEYDVFPQWCARDVLDDPRTRKLLKSSTHGSDQIRTRRTIAHVPAGHVALTRRRRPDQVELVHRVEIWFEVVEDPERVRLYECEWIVRLFGDIHADDVIPGAMQTHRRTARSAKQIERFLLSTHVLRLSCKSERFLK
jgi:hypothetical protein